MQSVSGGNRTMCKCCGGGAGRFSSCIVFGFAFNQSKQASLGMGTLAQYPYLIFFTLLMKEKVPQKEHVKLMFSQVKCPKTTCTCMWIYAYEMFHM